MMNTIIICGYGPGIADAVARRFGKEGHPVAIIARNANRLAKAVATLEAEGITAQAFVADLGNIEAIRRTIAKVRTAMGSIGILHWNAYSNIEGDLISVEPADLVESINVRVVGYIAAVQASLGDLETNHGAVLSTSGVMGLYGPDIDSFAKDFGVLAISVAAQHKATGILTQTLKPLGIYVGEVIVNGFVKHSESGSQHNGVLEPSDIANQFWKLNTTRTTHSVVFGETLTLPEYGYA